jgi:hypothetical protein
MAAHRSRPGGTHHGDEAPDENPMDLPATT